jgi:hypothetical protein
MKYRLILPLGIAGILLASACAGFLEEKSQDEVIPKTAVDFRELLLGSGYPPVSTQDPAYFLNYMDDDIELFFTYHLSDGSYIGTSEARTTFPTYTWQPYFGDFNGLDAAINENPASTAYYQYYERIKGCNAVLDYIDEAIGTREDRDRVKAEALAVRAYYYFKLVNLYGEPYGHDPDAPGVPLKLTSGVVMEIERATVAAVYGQIVDDLVEAARLMDPLVIVRKDYHVNQPAIHILLSRVYLHMERWEDCAREASKAFEQGTTLAGITTIEEVRAADNGYLTYNNPEVEWLFGSSAGGDAGAYSPAPAFLAMFDQVNDVRYTAGFTIDTGNDRGTVFFYKAVRGALEPKQVIRAAEACLNRAEANARLGNLAPALEDLNTLRRHRVAGYTDVNITDPQALLDAILLERRLEFCYEGFRWFDLRRQGMPAITHRYQNELTERVLVYTLQQGDPMYTLPFPNSLLLRNPGLLQNPSREIADRAGIPE